MDTHFSGDGNPELRAIIAEISNHLIFGNDCRKLGGVVKEGQGRSRLMIDTFLDQPMKSVIKTYIAGEILQV
jgi:hypothetical protein